MKEYTFTPSWRSAKTPIVLVESPDARWFLALRPCENGRRIARFVLLQTGELYWGDAYEVLHRDVMSFRKDAVEPVVVGVFVEDDRHSWRMGNAQWFMQSITDADTRYALAMLSRLAEWTALTGAMGNDPALTPIIGEGP